MMIFLPTTETLKNLIILEHEQRRYEKVEDYQIKLEYLQRKHMDDMADLEKDLYQDLECLNDYW